MRPVVICLLAALMLVAGCSFGDDDDGGGASIQVGELEQLTLQQQDVGRQFIPFDKGRQGIADRPVGTRSDVSRFGRLGGWKARYRRPGTTETRGPLVIASLVDAFEEQEGAEEDFAALKADLEDGELEWEDVEAPQLGDEAVARMLDQGSGPSRVSFFFIAWREANAVASVEVNGFAGKVEFAEALALARKQARRIEAAA